ncbi:YjbQ family protein [Candidatus Woesearchaeota archaeon]|nr:YjbQ family protein [Candidatus Woesearchaeota archaeon]
MIKEIHIETKYRNEFIDITDKVEESIKGFNNGLVVVFSQHTTAAITVNEGSDLSVKADIRKKLSDLVPVDNRFKHSEGNSDAHIKVSLIGPSETLIVKNGKLMLGTWQRLFLCEFDGPRNRKILLKAVKG